MIISMCFESRSGQSQWGTEFPFDLYIRRELEHAVQLFLFRYCIKLMLIWPIFINARCNVLSPADLLFFTLIFLVYIYMVRHKYAIH